MNEQENERHEPTRDEVIAWQWADEGWHSRSDAEAGRALRRALRRGLDR